MVGHLLLKEKWGKQIAVLGRRAWLPAHPPSPPPPRAAGSPAHTRVARRPVRPGRNQTRKRRRRKKFEIEGPRHAMAGVLGQMPSRAKCAPAAGRSSFPPTTPTCHRGGVSTSNVIGITGHRGAVGGGRRGGGSQFECPRNNRVSTRNQCATRNGFVRRREPNGSGRPSNALQGGGV